MSKVLGRFGTVPSCEQTFEGETAKADQKGWIPKSVEKRAFQRMQEKKKYKGGRGGV